MRKFIKGLQNTNTTVAGCGAGVIQIKQGIETHNYWLVASGVLTILMGVFATDAGK